MVSFARNFVIIINNNVYFAEVLPSTFDQNGNCSSKHLKCLSFFPKIGLEGTSCASFKSFGNCLKELPGHCKANFKLDLLEDNIKKLCKSDETNKYF